MLSPELTQQLLAILQKSSDPYEIARASGFLQTHPVHAAHAAPFFHRSLLALRLNAAADRFAKAAPATGGIIAWRSRARRFAANLAALDKRDPRTAALISEAAPTLQHYELHQTADGNFQILDLRQPLPLGWLAGLANHKLAANSFQFDRAETPVPHPIAFDGVNFGWMLLRILEATENSFLTYSCALYIFESDPAALAMLFHMHDLTQPLSGERLRWFVQTSAEGLLAEFRGAIESDPAWTLPQTFIRGPLTARPTIDLEPAIQRGQQHRAALRDLFGRLAASHVRPREQWAARYREALAPGSKNPLRILGITSRFTTVLQHSMAELLSAVHAAGMEMEIAIEPDDQSLENPFLERIVGFNPDLIVQLSRMRYENPLIPAGIPFLTWDQDNLPCMRTPQASTSVGDGLTFVAGQGALHGYVYLGWPAKSVIFCHLAAATHRYQPRALTADEESQLTCDFSYLSNAAQSPAALRDQHLPRFGGGAATVFSALCELILADPLDSQRVPWHDGSVRAGINTIATDRRIGLPDQTLGELVLSAMLVADRAFRHQTLQWVSDFCKSAGKTLRIYGSGWETHPTLAPHAAGVVHAGEHLQAITLATRINLQIIGTGVLHPRLLDGIAAGGFLMFRRTLNDVSNPPYLAALETVSAHVFRRGVSTFAELDAAADPQISAAWRVIAPEYRRSLASSGLGECVVLRGIATAHQLRHPTRLMPALDEIAFETPADFAARAAAFLADPAARAATAGRLRASLAEHFSYDARWRSFVAHIPDALNGG